MSDLCAALDVSRAGFYAWRQRDPSERDRADAVLGEEISATFARSRRTYGSPRVHRDLRRAGHACGRHRVARLMRGRGLAGRPSFRARNRAGTQGFGEPRPRSPTCAMLSPRSARQWTSSSPPIPPNSAPRPEL